MKKFLAVILCFGLVCGLGMGLTGCTEKKVTPPPAKDKEKDKTSPEKDKVAEKDKTVPEKDKVVPEKDKVEKK